MTLSLRKSFVVAAVLFSMFAFPLEVDAAKAAYCTDALERCYKVCGSGDDPISMGCRTGCNIGYLFCGS